MATTPLQPIVSGVDLTTDFEDVYTVPLGKDSVGIDAVVFNNYTDTTQSFTVRLVQIGTSTSLNEIITDKEVRPFRNDLASAMIGQALTAGGKIQVKASATSSINVNITATITES